MSFGADEFGDSVFGSSLGGVTSKVTSNHAISFNVVNALSISLLTEYTIKAGVVKNCEITFDLIGKIKFGTNVLFNTTNSLRRSTAVNYNIVHTVIDSTYITYLVDKPVTIVTNHLKVVLPAEDRKVLIKY